MKNSNKRKANIFGLAGLALVAGSVCILWLTFEPMLREEWRYFSTTERLAAAPVRLQAELPVGEDEDSRSMAAGFVEQVIRPVDEEFGIVIPKIGANAKVVANVDWKDGAVYQRALTQGVAHAAGTAVPGQPGNIFVFAHSGIDFYEAVRYNAVFYLLNKLEPGDEITLTYQRQKFLYRVTEQKIVAPEDISYLTGDPARETLTLMTCWPAGTTLRRLVVVAERVDR